MLGDGAIERKPPVEHREQDARRRDLRDDLAVCEFGERLADLGDAGERHRLGVDGHDEGVGGDQGVQREQPETRWAIDQDRIVGSGVLESRPEGERCEDAWEEPRRVGKRS